jgi:hypothetical protein
MVGSDGLPTVGEMAGLMACLQLGKWLGLMACLQLGQWLVWCPAYSWGNGWV